MSNRFHQHYHRWSHHTYQDPNIPDAGRDPIASHTNPWRGDFVVSAYSGAISSINIATNNLMPFSGSNIGFTTGIASGTFTSTGIFMTLVVNTSTLYIPLYRTP
jgi:hypothetical protein